MYYNAGIAAMNYYEELGVSRDARTKEIRQAYKTLARLLHPDGQADKRLRAMAELQMKRLNEILGILADPERRRKYDEELAGVREARARVQGPGAGDRTVAAAPLPGNQRMGRSRPGKPREPQAVESDVSRGAEWVQAAARHWFWVLIGGTCACTAVVWWTMPSEGAPAEVIRATPAASAIQLPVVKETTPRNSPKGYGSAPDVGRAGQERHPAQAVVDQAAGERPAEPPVLDLAASTRVPLDGVVATDRNENAGVGLGLDLGRRVGNPPQVDNLPHLSPFSGNWVYTPQAGESRDPEAYPAVYVELLLAEERDRRCAGRSSGW